MPDRTPPAPLTFYLAANGQPSWRLRAANGKGVTTPGETFSSKRKAIGNFETHCALLGLAKTQTRRLIDGARYDW